MDAKKATAIVDKKEVEKTIYPLIDTYPTSKDEIKLWWSKMDYDLEITEELGNCVGCFKKSDIKIWSIAKSNPQLLDFNLEMEEKYHKSNAVNRKNDNEEYSCFFYRGNRSTKEMIEQSKSVNFNEFKEKKGYQMTFFNHVVYEDFSCDECGTIF